MHSKFDVSDLLIGLGGLALVGAAGWIFPPAGLAIAGLELLLVGLFIAQPTQQPPRR